MRRRTRNNQQQEAESAKNNDAAAAALLDEDEQEEIVKALEEVASQQQQQINTVFFVVCLLMAAASMGVTFLESNNGWKHVFAHAIYASILHVTAARNATRLSVSEAHDYVLAIIPVGIPLLPLYMMSDGFDHGMEPHVALAVGNLFTTLCSIMLRRDANSTLRALEELESSKYRYKSL